jgi:spore maturation protein CgeB
MKLLHIGLMATENGSGSFSRALRKYFDCYEIELKDNWKRRALEVAKEWKPDIIFLQIQAPNIIDEDTASELTKYGFTINWTGDVRQPIPEWYEQIAKHVNLTSFSNEHDVNQFSRLGYNSEFLQIGFDETIFKNEYNSKIHNFDIVFLGQNYAGQFPLSTERFNMVSHMKRHFGSKFGVFGSGWRDADGSALGNQVHEAKIYNTAKIGINHSHFNIDRYSSDRLFRLMGSGTMCLSHHYIGIEKDFEIGKHLDTYNSFEELTNKVSYYLNNEIERNKIAMAGYDYVRENFTFDNMAKNIKTIYEKWTKTKH